MKISSTPVVARMRKLKATYSLEAQQDLEAIHGSSRDRLYEERLKIWQDMDEDKKTMQEIINRVNNKAGREVFRLADKYPHENI